ncbi:hypothetical protein [Parapedobacter soli]|uniref:hypothetical protein n=1 Tax=Parapedobacter soli TaxID=416955 RepID=UPI0021CAB503|nr:hypothetical protein [Parapedobacter soli]
MNWTSFLLTLALIYLAYYGLNLLYDLFTTRRPPGTEKAGNVLFFDEDVRPQIIEPADDPLPESGAEPTQPAQDEADVTPLAERPPIGLSGPILSTGAVGLKELFNLAKDNLIEHTRAISY